MSADLHVVTDDEAKLRELRDAALRRFTARYRHNPGTQRTMLGSLRRLATVFSNGTCDETTFPWELVVNADLSEQICGTVAQNYATRTVSKDASALRQLLDCCRRVGLLDYEQYRQARDFEVRGGTPRPPTGTFLTEADVAAIVGRATQGSRHANTRLRDTAFILTLASSGARGWEVTGATLDQTFLDESRIWLVRTKGGAQRNAWLHPVTVDALRSWIAVRGDAPGALFVPLASNGRPMVEHGTLSVHQARKIVRRIASEAGYGTVTPHDFRRFVVSTLLERKDIALVAGVVGHKKPTTTALYDRRPLQRQREAVESLVLPSLDSLSRPPK